jgi:splicing factor U2AF 65 kDa subunit
VTEGYRLYLERRKQKRLEEKRRAAALNEGMEGGLKLRKVDLKDFPNYKRKLVVQNIPLEFTEEQIMNYFFTVLSSIAKEEYAKNPIMSVTRYKDLGFVTLDFRKREDAEICLNLDGTEFRSGSKMRILRVKRFMDEWNAEIEKGRNPIQSLNNRATGSSNFTGQSRADKSGDHEETKKEGKKGVSSNIDDQRDNRIYMGGVPYNMSEIDVRKMCESFGRLKNFNLIKDPANPDLNKGYAFFEYADDRSTDKAIKALNGLEFKDKKLKV